jgi:hypothetical protein
MITVGMALARFNAGIGAFMTASSLRTDIVLKKTAFDLLASILRPPPYGTHPVDTGRARAGWYTSMRELGMPTNNLYSRLKSTSQVESGRSEGRYREHLGVHVSNKYIQLVNGVKYILYLEYGGRFGHSPQAPNGMVRVSIRRMLPTASNNISMGIKNEWDR